MENRPPSPTVSSETAFLLKTLMRLFCRRAWLRVGMFGIGGGRCPADSPQPNAEQRAIVGARAARRSKVLFRNDVRWLIIEAEPRESAAAKLICPR